jgi:cytoskeleton protein RodZ
MAHNAGLGALLRECRETKGLSLEDLSRDTRIASRLLLALEEDRFKDLPAPIFVRGFIRSYCAVVGEPPERALAFYDTESGAARGPSAVPRAAALVQAPARTSRLRLPRLSAKLGIAGALVLVAGVAYFLGTSAASRPSDAPSRRETPPGRPAPPTAAVSPAAAQVPAARAAAVPAPPPIVVAPAPRPTTPPVAVAAPVAAPAPAGVAPVARSPHVLVARAHEPTWVSVRAGDEAASQEMLEAGSVREWQSANRFTVTVGNAGGLTLELDGVALPPLGAQGQVVRDVRLPRDPTP